MDESTIFWAYLPTAKQQQIHLLITEVNSSHIYSSIQQPIDVVLTRVYESKPVRASKPSFIDVILDVCTVSWAFTYVVQHDINVQRQNGWFLMKVDKSMGSCRVL